MLFDVVNAGKCKGFLGKCWVLRDRTCTVPPPEPTVGRSSDSFISGRKWVRQRKGGRKKARKWMQNVNNARHNHHRKIAGGKAEGG